MRIALITGTRPQIIKSAPLLKALKRRDTEILFIHTGQHYDYELAAQFVEELSIWKPDFNLDIGSGSNVYQTYEIIRRLSSVLEDTKPDTIVVPGDTNSALAAALVGFKIEIPTCHLESGLRSYDMMMQEELNRRLIDHGAAALFAPTDVAVRNLEREHVAGEVFQTGDTMYDILQVMLPRFSTPDFYEEVMEGLKLSLEDYAVLTLHRRENVDDPRKLKSALDGLDKLKKPIVFPMHPRTEQKIAEGGFQVPANVKVIDPVPYGSMMALVSKASLLLTDSGGLQKEAYLLNTPCVTIRNNTEWVETLEAGSNVLSSVNPDDIVSKTEMMWGRVLDNDPTVYGDGHASEKIVTILESEEIEIPSSSMI